MKKTNVIVLLFLLAVLVAGVKADQFVTTNPALTTPHSFNIEFVEVGDPCNAGTDGWQNTTETLGDVAYKYRMGKTEVTVGQLAAMEYSINGSTTGLTSTMAAGGVNTLRMLTYANWLNAGCPTGGNGLVDGGVYNMDWGYIEPWPNVEDQWDNGDGTKNIWRHKDAKYFLPTEDELIKAAFYKGGSTNAGYWFYPTGSDTAPVAEGASAGTNSANYAGAVAAALNAGSYPNTKSPYGALDMGGNLWEACEVRYSTGENQYMPGWAGCYIHGATWLHGMIGFEVRTGVYYDDLGFRIAAAPTPVVLSADFNNDGTVDACDLDIFSQQWLTE